MKETIRYSFTLALICFLASGILAVVNAITEPQIKIQKDKEENALLEAVMPDSAVFKPKIQDGKIIYYMAYDTKNKLNGFVIKSEGKGYSSSIEVFCGLDLKLEITNTRILSQNETPGLGSNVSGEPFLKQFQGKGLDSFNQIQAITGATISSAAVINSVKNKILELKGQLLKDIQNER